MGDVQLPRGFCTEYTRFHSITPPVVNTPRYLKRKSVRDVSLPWRIYKVVLDGPEDDRKEVELYAGQVETEAMADALIFGMRMKADYPETVPIVELRVKDSKVVYAKVPYDIAVDVGIDGNYTKIRHPGIDDGVAEPE